MEAEWEVVMAAAVAKAQHQAVGGACWAAAGERRGLEAVAARGGGGSRGGHRDARTDGRVANGQSKVFEPCKCDGVGRPFVRYHVLAPIVGQNVLSSKPMGHRGSVFIEFLSKVF